MYLSHKKWEKVGRKMLIGRQDSRIDEKNRISFPKKFRSELGDNLIITQGFESSLIVVAKDSWEILISGTEGKPITNKAARETETFLLGSAEEVELDAKGRFILPKYLKKYAGLTTDVVCLGVLKYVRIFDKKKWEEHNLRLIDEIGSITERLDENE